MKAMPASNDWHPSQYLSQLTPSEAQYLALFGASELFAQLDQEAPRPPRRTGRKGAGRKRQNGLENSAPSASLLMNLYGSSELAAQLNAENGLDRAKTRWTPKYRRAEGEADFDQEGEVIEPFYL